MKIITLGAFLASAQSLPLRKLTHIDSTPIYFLAKNWKVWCFMAEVMILRVSLSKSKVSKRSGFWVLRKVKT
jgi:hypothetical protein